MTSTPASLKVDSPQPPGLPSRSRKTPRSTDAAMRLDMKPPTRSSSGVRAPYNEPGANFKGEARKFVLGAWKSPRPGSSLAGLMEEAQRLQIAERIRELRQRSRMTQPQIADKLGITLRAYQKMEAKGTTKWERVQELGEIHNVDPELIWTGEEEVAPTDRLARMEAKLDDLLARFEALALELDEEAVARRSAASAEPSEAQEPANGNL